MPTVFLLRMMKLLHSSFQGTAARYIQLAQSSQNLGVRYRYDVNNDLSVTV